MTLFAFIALGLFAAREIAAQALSVLNRRHVMAHAGRLPETFRGVMDQATYDKATRYTLSKSRFESGSSLWDLAVVLGALLSGVLPWAWQAWTGFAGASIWAAAAGLFVIGTALSLPDLPWEWWSQFRLEERFGFNTSTQRTWWLDRVRAFALGAVLGIPLLALLLWLVERAGDMWWIWGWAAITVFQGVLLIVAPIVILPLFNKFQPLPEGTLRERLLRLAERTGFRTRGIEIMDGSRRSRHANAFFTGLGRFRRIILFDTLVAQLDEAEVEAVLAHEIGHYRRRHVPKLLASSVVLTFVGFAAIAWLAREPWFFAAFGFREPSVPVAMLLFTLLSPAVTFWFSPLSNALSRRFEYQADAFAAQAVGAATPLIRALRKLYEKNLGNLTPHPLYSSFHYSHPTLLERERALGGTGS